MMDAFTGLMPGWNQDGVNDLLVLLGVVGGGLWLVRFILRSVLGVLFFRLRYMIIAFLVSVAGGVPLAGFGGAGSLVDVGTSIRVGACNASYSVAVHLNGSGYSALRYVGRSLYSNTIQVCGWY